MAKKFDMGDFAKTLAQPVSDSDTGREQIEYIDVDLLDSDPNNFYQLSDLDRLADNIATIGLQQPIRVRDGENGHVVIVSGHRRAAAIRKLVAEGRTDLRDVPCIREQGDVSPALRELRLIYANSATRDLSSAEISQQAEKVRELLYQLKEEGYEFPGRMRDHVAEACKISRSKLARLDVIRKSLAPDICKVYWDGPQTKRMSEDTAYNLARLPVAIQWEVVDAYRGQAQDDSGLKYLYAGTVEAVAQSVDKISDAKAKCPDGAACTHKSAQIAHAVKVRVKDRWLSCGCERGCCAKCGALQSCKSVCPKLLSRQKELKATAKAERQREAAEKEARQRPDIERVGAIWQRFGTLREQAGLTPKQYFEKIDCPYSGLIERAESLEAGREKIEPNEGLPFGYNVSLSGVERWVAAADALGCSVDYLMMRTNEPRMADELAAEPRACAGQTSFAAWMPGGTTPAAPCDAVADFKLGNDDGRVIRMTCRWDGKAFLFKKGKEPINSDVVRWLALPDVEEESDD